MKVVWNNLERCSLLVVRPRAVVRKGFPEVVNSDDSYRLQMRALAWALVVFVRCAVLSEKEMTYVKGARERDVTRVRKKMQQAAGV